MTEINDLVNALERAFVNHMMWEYPDIDPCRRGELAYELALTATTVIAVGME